MIAHSKEKMDELYANLLIDPNFEKLELFRNQPNIFEVLKLQHYEIRHSNFLGWLLDPNGNHGIGDYFLRRFLIKILQDPRANHSDYIDKGVYNVVDIHQLLNQFISVHREQDYIDILIEFDKAVIVIENKIHATEGNDQLARYKKFIEENYPKKKPIFVYLTKYGVEASINDYFIEMSYLDDVLNYLNDLVQFRSDSIQEQVLFYIKDYINNLNINVMKQSEANVIAEKIYRQHQELFDFIINNRPDPINIIKAKIDELLIEQGYKLGSIHKHFSRFLPQEIDEIVPKKKQKTDWKEGELFLWEFRYPTDKEEIEFKIAIAPFHEDKIDDTIKLFEQANLQLLKKFPNNWIVYESKFYKLDYALIYDDGYIESIFQQIMAEQKPKIEKLSKVIIENQAILKTN